MKKTMKNGMKKLMTAAMILVMAGSFAACGSQNKNEGNGAAEGNTQAAGNTQTAGNVQTADADGQVDMAAMTMVYGKVTSMVGNELELKIGNIPEAEDEGTAEEAPAGAVSAGAAASVVATAPTEPMEFELEYTGETMKVTVSAGIDIWNMGEKSTLNSISEGSVIALLIENADTEDAQIREIQIVY